MGSTLGGGAILMTLFGETVLRVPATMIDSRPSRSRFATAFQLDTAKACDLSVGTLAIKGGD
jgi:hypothetical protein